MDPLTPNRVAFPGLAGVACRSWCASRWPSPVPLPVGNPLPGCRAPLRLARPLGTFGRQGVWQRTRFPLLHRAFSSVAGFGGPKLTWLRQKASSPKPGSRGVPLAVGRSPLASLLWHAMFPFFHSPLKGESHASVCGPRSHALIPTGAHSRPAALPKPIIISVPRPHCWKGSASKPYVELPPHTAPLGMEVGPAQACAVKVVVHDLRTTNRNETAIVLIWTTGKIIAKKSRPNKRNLKCRERLRWERKGNGPFSMWNHQSRVKFQPYRLIWWLRRALKSLWKGTVPFISIWDK